MKHHLTKANAQTVLIFNSYKKLIAVCCSVNETAKLLGVSAANVHHAYSGKHISCQQYYIRLVPKDIEIELSDIGKLKVTEFDEACGLERKYYKTAKMDRTGSKYNMLHRFGDIK